MAQESREISNIKKVVLRGYGEMFIEQEEIESLVIETDEEFMDRVKTRVEDGVLHVDVVGDWLDRITTFFARGYESQRIKYHLRVRELEGLNVSGAAQVEIDGLEGEELSVRLGGAADINIDDLDVNHLQVALPGAGNIKARGRTESQEVHVGGAGAYSARKLESQSAKIRITGVGKAIVNAVEELEISVTGLGSVEYYGKPRVTQNVSGLGNVTSRG